MPAELLHAKHGQPGPCRGQFHALASGAGVTSDRQHHKSITNHKSITHIDT